MKKAKGRQHSDTCFNGKTPTREESAPLFAAYAKNRSIANRNKIVEMYLPLAESIAKTICKKLPSHVDYEELLSSAYTGLIQAVERFDLRRRTNFTTHANYRIRGHIFDDLRDNGKFPRLVMDRLKRISRAESLLFTTLGRPPTPQEIADAVGLPLDKCNDVRSIGLPEFVILDDAGENGFHVKALTPNDIKDSRAADPFEHLATKELATLAITNLPTPINLYVWHYFFGHRNLREIGGSFGFSDSRMSQLVTYAIKRMRITLEHASLRGAA